MDDMMLIVDDVEMNREILKVLFESKYEIMEAESGEEALEILERCQGSIDIVLLDLMMSGISGFEIMEKKKEMEFLKNVPVVVISSSNEMEAQIRAFELGANDFITKPFMPEIVVSRVSNVMASNRRMISIELEAQKMKVKAESDEMTGLYNKSATEQIMDSTLKGSEGRLQAMFIIDIDNFKTVNDTAGHQAGDHVIKIIADLISSYFRKTDIVGRIGGDEFCVMMVDVPSMNIVYEKANELVQVMKYKPNLAIPQYVTLSIGIAINDKKNTCYEHLFKKADEALYAAKQGGKAQYREYGVEAIQIEMDDRPAIILIGNNRNVCSVIHGLVPQQLQMVEVLRLEDIDVVTKQQIEHTKAIIVDVSEQSDNTFEYWNKVKQIPWITMDKVLAICQEGNKTQYIESLNEGVSDMLTTPIDADAFKRRIAKLLDKLQLNKEG